MDAGKIVDGSIGAFDLASGSVFADELASGAVGATDVGRFAGTFSGLDFGTVDVSTCKSVTSASLTPVSANQDLGDDAIVVTPERTFPSAGLTVTAKPAGADQIEVTICNVAGPAGLALGPRSFHFVTFDAAG